MAEVKEEQVAPRFSQNSSTQRTVFASALKTAPDWVKKRVAEIDALKGRGTNKRALKSELITYFNENRSWDHPKLRQYQEVKRETKDTDSYWWGTWDDFVLCNSKEGADALMEDPKTCKEMRRLHPKIDPAKQIYQYLCERESCESSSKTKSGHKMYDEASLDNGAAEFLDDMYNASHTSCFEGKSRFKKPPALSEPKTKTADECALHAAKQARKACENMVTKIDTEVAAAKGKDFTTEIIESLQESRDKLDVRRKHLKTQVQIFEDADKKKKPTPEHIKTYIDGTDLIMQNVKKTMSKLRKVLDVDAETPIKSNKK